MILTIILFICIGLNILWTWLSVKSYKNYEKSRRDYNAIVNRALRELDVCRELKDDITARYQVERMHEWFIPAPGAWVVVKTHPRGKEYCVIKAFTDEDDEFNQREAQELCDILNAK